MKLVTDESLTSVPIALLIEAISEFMVADFEGKATTPPRHAVDFPKGKLVFTTGGSERIAGFRAYETFESSSRASEDQVVAVWDTQTCSLRGICIGAMLGALRTGAMGGIASRAMVSQPVTSCAIVGTGLQAETQLLATLCVHELSDVRVFSREKSNRTKFVKRFRDLTQITAFDNPQLAVDGAEIVILATNSRTPVVQANWLQEAIHITTVGPKIRGAHELPLDLIDDDFLLVSDSPQQISDEGKNHMLFNHPRMQDLVHLGEVISQGRPTLPTRSLFLSAGLSGTEVIALDAVVTHLDR